MKKVFNGITISYRYTYNKAKDKIVLLLHGWGGNLNSFRFLEKYLIEKDFSVLTIDFPGFGGSDLPTEDFCMMDYYKIVSELVAEEQLQKISIVSHSFGGRVAILFSALEPEKVNKVVLCDSAGIKPKFSLKKKCKILKYKIAKKLKNIGLIKRDLINYGSEDYKALPESMKPVFSRIINTDLTKYLIDITAPTLVIWGKNDKDTPFYMAKELNKGIRDSAIVTLDGGHFCYLQNADKFKLIIENFLNN